MQFHAFWLTALAVCSVISMAQAHDADDLQDGFVPFSGSKKSRVGYTIQPSLQLGGFGEGPDQLGGADSVEVDHRGNVYVVDDVQRQIKVWKYHTRNGQVHEIVGSGDVEAAGLGPLGEIRGIAIDRNGRGRHGRDALYILDRDKNRDPELRILLRRAQDDDEDEDEHDEDDDEDEDDARWSQLAFTDFQKTPNDLAIDRWGRIIVAEKKGIIEVLSPDGSAHDTNFANAGVLKVDEYGGIETDDFKAVDIDHQGNIYVSDKDVGRMLAISPEGVVVQSFGSQGPGHDQFLEQVEGIAVDWRGNVYGRDESGDRILAFAPDGSFLAAFGERGFDPHQQENADEFTIDVRRKRFIWADNNNYRVSVHQMRHRRRVRSRIFTQYDFPEAPVVEPVWIAGGTQGSAPGNEFNEPNELGFDSNGRLWAGDVFNYRVQIFEADGTFVATVGGEGNGPCQFAVPGSGKFGAEAIREGGAHQMFVVDRGGQKINVYDNNDLSCLRQITSPLLEDPTGLAIDSAGDLYVADQATDLIHHFTNDGTFVRTFQADADGQSILSKTETLALDEGRNRLFASSENESRVEVFELSSGTYLGEHVGERQVGVISQDGRFADDVEGIAADLTNEWLLMSDEDNGRFVIGDLSSADLFDDGENYAFLGAFGVIGNAPGEFLSADGVAVSESQGLVAIADQGNYRIQVFRVADIRAALGLP